MGILVITVDLECSRCRSKITKVLDCLKEEYCIEKVEFDDKNKKVVVRGKFDAEKLCKKVWSKAGTKVVKEIAIAEVWPMPPAPKPCKPDPKCDCTHCKPATKPEEPKPKPKPPVKCDCDHCCKPCCNCKPDDKKPADKEKEKEKEKKPEKPKPEYKLVPYPYPYPYTYPMTCPSWPSQCPPQQQCQGCQPPPPPTPPPPACSCSSHGSCSCHGVWPPQPPAVWPPQPPVWPPPPAWGGCSVVADENSCSVM
nr:unnamed protein product [Digitaria exilis]